MRTYLLGLVVAVGLVMSASPAAAGGWWSSTYLDPSNVVVGATVTFESEAFFPTNEAAQTTEPYYAYLVRGFDRHLLQAAMSRAEPKRWWALKENATTIRVGEVSTVGMEGNVGTARVTMTIPRIEPGRYALMLCNAGCTEPFARAIPGYVRVVETPSIAQLATRADRLERRLLETRFDLHRVRTGNAHKRRVLELKLDAVGRQADDADAAQTAGRLEVEALQRANGTLEARVADLEGQQQSLQRLLRAAGVVALVLLALAAAAWLVRRRRQRTAQPPQRTDAEWERPAPLVGSGRR